MIDWGVWQPVATLQNDPLLCTLKVPAVARSIDNLAQIHSMGPSLLNSGNGKHRSCAAPKRARCCWLDHTTVSHCTHD